MHILVTGTGANVGQAICKILADYKECKMVVGTDLHKNHAGKFLCNQFFILPHYRDKGYLDEIKRIIKLKSIDIIIPASEPELKYFCNSGIQKISSCPIIRPDRKIMQIGFDKFRTVQFLKENKLPFPETEIINNINNPIYPSVLKSRSGSGSKNIFILNNENDFYYFKNKYPAFILQEYLNDEDNEYTCGLFRSKAGETRAIIFKRKLAGGYSVYGEVVDCDEIDDLLLKLSEKLNLTGSINVQLRLTKKGPVIFEINPRFSSTVYFRHLMGFKDLVWAIEDRFENKISPYKKPGAGSTFYRGDQEYYNLV